MKRFVERLWFVMVQVGYEWDFVCYRYVEKDGLGLVKVDLEVI